ncbi:hypothetical protein PGTUg99_002970 [Puccinia graminis f. sp. tritici]|uniref:Uncharacterized protein n=1 Tax=Puccinia graminis f. sp. tritici TaxID=56615 RepID=A0A5B0SLF0_PUCGR|nr:hypothetical protein PGTUg99_002970 [Puccinia graminis f. sp. tritici]
MINRSSRLTRPIIPIKQIQSKTILIGFNKQPKNHYLSATTNAPVKQNVTVVRGTGTKKQSSPSTSSTSIQKAFQESMSPCRQEESRRAGMYTSSSGGVPPGKVVHRPARRKGFLPTSWCSRWEESLPTSWWGGIPPGEPDFKPARQEESLPASWYKDQLVGRDSFRKAGALVGRESDSS